MQGGPVWSLTFDGLTVGQEVGDYYLASDGVHFSDGFTVVDVGAPSTGDLRSVRLSLPVVTLTSASPIETLSFYTTPLKPFTIRFYDGPDGTGNLLREGVVDCSDPPWCPEGGWIGQPAAFSVVFESTPDTVWIDTLTSDELVIPEPSTAWLALLVVPLLLKARARVCR
jgi:hypothetical protein